MRTAGAALILMLGLMLVHCAPPEQMVVDTYLGAVRDGETALVEGVSLVDFPGEGVSAWEVVTIGPESTESYRLAELRTAVADAKKAHEDKIAAGDDFLRANEEIAIRYQQKMREDEEYRYPSGRMKEFQEAWDMEIEAREELEAAIADAEAALEEERKAIQMSTKVGVKSSFEGDVSVKKVTVRVDESGGSKTYDLTLRRYNLTDSATGISPTPNWIVVDVAG